MLLRLLSVECLWFQCCRWRCRHRARCLHIFDCLFCQNFRLLPRKWQLSLNWLSHHLHRYAYNGCCYCCCSHFIFSWFAPTLSIYLSISLVRTHTHMFKLLLHFSFHCCHHILPAGRYCAGVTARATAVCACFQGGIIMLRRCRHSSEKIDASFENQVFYFQNHWENEKQEIDRWIDRESMRATQSNVHEQNASFCEYI